MLSSGRACAIAGAVICAGGCAPTVVAELPPEVGWVAVLELDAAGTLLAATPLTEHRADEPLSSFVDPQHQVLVVGYTRAQLAELEPSIDRAEALRGASGCEQALPPPHYLGALESALIQRPAEQAPLLTASWLLGQCAPTPQPAVVLECEQLACRAALSRDGCRFQVRGCPGGEPSLSLDRHGRACVAAAAPLSCTSSASRLLCEAALPESGGCRVDVYSSTAAPFLQGSGEPAVVQLPGAVPFVGVFGDGALKDIRFFSLGYILGMTVLGSEVLLSAPSPLAPQDCLGTDTPQPPSTVFAYDADSLALRWSAPGPECLQNLSPDPAGTGFVASLRSGGSFQLGRFDAAAQLQAAAPLALGALDPAQVRIAQLQVYPVPRRILVLSSYDGPGARLAVHDLDTLDELAHLDLPEGAWSFDPLDDSRALLVDQRGGGLCRYDVRRLSDPDCGPGSCMLPALYYWISSVLHHPPSGAILAAVDRQREQIWMCGEEVQAVSYYEHATQPGPMHPWPTDQGLVLLSGVSRDFAQPGAACSALGALNLLDPLHRQILPGTWCLPGGVVSAIREDAKQRLWLALPWDGKLVRLTPR